MVFQDARYCNGISTLRRNSTRLAASIHSILSDVFFLFSYAPVTKMVTVGSDRTSSLRSQSRTGVLEAEKEPLKPDCIRLFCTF